PAAIFAHDSRYYVSYAPNRLEYSTIRNLITPHLDARLVFNLFNRFRNAIRPQQLASQPWNRTKDRRLAAEFAQPCRQPRRSRGPVDITAPRPTCLAWRAIARLRVDCVTV